MDFCPNFTGWTIGTGSFNSIVARMRCGMWACDYCREKNQAVWKAKIGKSLERHDCNWWFWTWTAHEHCHGAKTSLANLKRGWGEDTSYFGDVKMVKGIMVARGYLERPGLRDFYGEQFGKDNWLWLRVYEPHPTSGRIHVHMISNLSPKDQAKCEHRGLKHGSREFKECCRAHGMGYQTDIQSIGDSIGKVCAYVTKYLTKDLDNLPAYTRRIEHSANFLLDDSDVQSDYLWRRVGLLTKSEVEQEWDLGNPVEDINLGHVIKKSDFLGGLYEPILKS